MRLDFLAIWLDALSNTFKRKGNHHSTLEACLNCQQPVTENDEYCSNCGQKLMQSYITIWSLLGDFLSNFFDLDNRVLRSLKMLIIPGYLAKKYMEGKRKTYLNPIRFFFFLLVILFSIISFNIDFSGLERFLEGNYKAIAKSEFKTEYSEWKKEQSGNIQNLVVLDSFETKFFKGVKNVENDTTSYNLNLAGVNMRDYHFLRKDLYEMNEDSLLVHYKIDKFWERLIVQQYVRSMRNPDGAIQFFVGNMLWGILSTIFLLSLSMKLLYIRNKRYYVEHSIVLFTIHTFAFVLISISIGLNYLLDEGQQSLISLVSAILIWMYGYLSVKRYYGQGHIKTFIKWGIILFLYFIIILVMIGVVLLASLLLFQ